MGLGPVGHLTSADMQKLCELRACTRRPLSVLLHEAVSVLYELTRQAPSTPDDSRISNGA